MISSRRATCQALLGLIAVCAVSAPARADERAAVRELDTLSAALATSIDARVVEVLPCIDGVGGKLLALRSYLRAGDQLAMRWSWTGEQIAAFEGSREQLELDAGIQRVREHFERANPGYELFVNPQVRSLDLQLASWNRNASVAAAAERLLADAIAQFSMTAPPGQGVARLRAYLQSYIPIPLPTVAAPGLSPHGQMRAVDFQVLRGAEIVAGTDTRTIDTSWVEQGWAARLETAVRAAGGSFVGPLVSPREPWHYTYVPAAAARQ